MPTLHIIGNGFDLAHGLPTSYWDYHQFLKENGEDWFIGMMENYFGNTKALDNFSKQGNILWSDLEKALGEYDVDCIFRYLKECHRLVYGHSMEDVDMPYFEEVQRKVQPNTRWHFSYYDYDEIDKKRDKAHSIGAKLCSNPFFQI